MPNLTFEKLKSEKKKRIFDCSVDEFSKHTFTNASINQIIKNADIPRGSFYQYFKDKEDLYEYVISEIRKEKIEVLYEMDKKHTSQFVDAFKQSMYYMFEWSKRNPKYFQLGMLMEKDSSDFIKQHKKMTSLGLDRFKSIIREDQENAFIRKDIDIDLMLELIVTSGVNLVSHCQNNGELDNENFIDKMEKILDLLQNGFKG